MKNIFFPKNWLVLPVLLALLVIWPMFKPGFWKSDDGEWMVIRFSAFHQSFKDGQFPVRWVQNLNRGYGYPVFNFLYPLPFYLAEVPHLLGTNFSSSIELVFALSIIFAGLGMFCYARKWGSWAALLSTSLYLFAPYRLFLVYTRGSLGESLALAFIPWIFLFADKVKSWRKIFLNICLLATTYAALVLSHNVIALLFTPLLLAYFFRQSLRGKKRLAIYYFSALTLGLSLSAFFWLPALAELRYTRAAQLVIADYDRYLLDTAGLLQKVGLIPILLVVISLLRKRFFFSLVALLVVLLTHQLATPIDNLIPFLGKIQFPWRLLTVFMFASAASAGELFGELKTSPKLKKLLVIIISALLFLETIPALSKVDYVNRDQGFYTTNDDTTTVQNEFTPVWVKVDPQNRPASFFEIEANPEAYQIIDQESKTGFHYLQLRLENDVIINYNLHYFPGWKVYLDDNELQFNPKDTQGIIKFKINLERNNLRTIKIKLEKTKIQQISELISFISWVCILFYLVFSTLAKRNFIKSVAITSAAISVIGIGYFIYTHFSTYTQKFDEKEMETAYLNSQWVNPFNNNIPIGDSGLYQWAGWKYIHGENPILINPEMPPLGKYLIGLGLLIFQRPALVGFTFVVFALVSHYFLAKEVLSNKWLALIATSLLSYEQLLKSILNTTMLDALQLGFLNLTFIFFLKGLKKRKWFIVASLMLGGVISTKFYIGGLLVLSSLIFYLIITKKMNTLVYFSLTLPLAGLIHLVSYSAYLAKGNSLRDYLGVQKWIYLFYRQGNVDFMPPGSYWLLVLFNRWRVWFGQEWGKYNTIKSDMWSISWPLNVLALIIFLIKTLKKRIDYKAGVLLSWLFVYSLFLTFIIGWPHYLLLFLPYSSILLVKLTSDLVHKLNISTLKK